MLHLSLVRAMLCVGILSPLAIDETRAGSGERSCCLCGKKVCKLEVKKEKESVTRFEVESKEICIPAIRLPWQKCGTRRCGKTRTVCVLKEIKKEKTVCKYDWSVKTICVSCCRRQGLRHGSNCVQTYRDEQVPFEYYTARRLLQLPEDTGTNYRQSKILARVIPGEIRAAETGQVALATNEQVLRPIVPTALTDRESMGSKPVTYSIAD